MVPGPMIREIDVMHLGRDRVIAAHEVDGLIVDPGPESTLETLLEGLGDAEPRAILLTHIHLDHAGATGALVRRFPHLRVYVHERGAPHLADPSKLLASATRLYGGEMERLWGEVLPVPEASIRALSGGERVEGFRVEYTPGHAWHHVAYLHEETGEAFVGDVCGVIIPPSGYAIAPTPPPDIDLERWQLSLDAVERWRPAALRLTHFGYVGDVEEQILQVRERLRNWGELARAAGRDEFVREVEEEILESADPDTAVRFFQAAPPDQLYAGLARYWKKQEETTSAR
ncbi:MAG: MBL fold metallo-hydrolase [Thermoleophilaceae bacterium]|nr:MBL fold metallo-hydrolase [Thermoleophilaceae bacterium]